MPDRFHIVILNKHRLLSWLQLRTTQAAVNKWNTCYPNSQSIKMHPEKILSLLAFFAIGAQALPTQSEGLLIV